MSSATSYRIGPTPHNGLGLFATRPIKAGELIIAERPLFIATNPRTINAAVDKLNLEKKAAFFSLVDSFSTSSQPDPVTIFRTNALPSGTAHDEGRVYEIICRINHSCSPNAQWSWSQSAGHETVYAATDIPIDTEITTTYIPNLHPYIMRSRHLLKDFHFTCRCSACSSAGRVDSDIRRTRIHDLDNLIQTTTEKDSPGGLRFILEHIRLMDEEGLHDYGTSANDLFDAAQIAAFCCDDAKGKRYVGLAYAHRMLSDGAEAENTKALLAQYHDPKKLVLPWNPRKPQKLPVVCDACGAEAGKIGAKGDKIMARKCPDCKCAIWCSTTCWKAHSPIHKPVCEVLKIQ